MVDTPLEIADVWLNTYSSVVSEAVSAWLKSGEWTPLIQLQRSLARRGGATDAVDGMEGLPLAVGRIDPPDNHVTLRIRAIRTTHLADEVLRGVVTALRLAVDKFLSDEPSPRLGEVDLAKTLKMDNPLRARVSQLLLAEDWMLGSGSNDPGSWSREIHKSVLTLRGIETVEDYLTVEGERPWNRPRGTSERPQPVARISDLRAEPIVAPAIAASPPATSAPVPQTPPRISGRSRRRFADLCAHHGTIASIREVMEEAGLAGLAAPDRPDGWSRRDEAKSFELLIDLRSDRDNLKLANAYVEAIEEFGRTGIGTLTDDAARLTNSLRIDGVPIGEDGRLTARLPSISADEPAVDIDLSDYSRLADPGVLADHVRRINKNATEDPGAAIGSCKELLESACKLILNDYGEPDPGKIELVPLYKKAAKVLKLDADDIPDDVKGSKAAQSALRSMTSVVQAMAELRNALGTGHGQAIRNKAVSRHARLTVSLTIGVVQFLLDTWHERRGVT